MDYQKMEIRALENCLRKYIDDAANLAAGIEIHRLNCWLDGIETPEALSRAIKECGDRLLERIKAIRNAAPVVRGDTISIYGEPPETEPNAPSEDDENFMIACRRQLRERGYVLAADADKYEAIAAKYPSYAHPARVRGAEARRWLALRQDDIVSKKINRKR